MVFCSQIDNISDLRRVSLLYSSSIPLSSWDFKLRFTPRVCQSTTDCNSFVRFFKFRVGVTRVAGRENGHIIAVAIVKFQNNNTSCLDQT